MVHLGGPTPAGAQEYDRTRTSSMQDKFPRPAVLSLRIFFNVQLKENIADGYDNLTAEGCSVIVFQGSVFRLFLQCLPDKVAEGKRSSL